MGSCFSRGKGRSSVPNTLKDKDEAVFEGAEIQTTLNGNNIIETALLNNSATTSLHRERSGRTFYTRMPSVGKTPDVRIGKSVSETKINTLFDNYKDSLDDIIFAEGIEKLCADLGLSPDEFKVLIFAWKLDAAQMCRFTREEFVAGCRSMCVDSIRGIQMKLPEIVSQVSSNPDVFKDLYRFTFRFGLDSSIGQRILPTDMAIVLWKLVFSVREPPILSRWLNFLSSHQHIRGIPRDTWNMFLNFSEAVGDDLSTYDDTEAWPSIFDDFVEFENDQANQNITSKEKDNDVIH
ncbi:DCN1-like protein 3 [Cimex lectularius]|uniref:Defective in cullin neddylation protein n=1 Tax=Cimex lectularius TaxID=79782 RepID=A0A8I6RBU3_CIMLE|nr:DCN1-like protein 3 [Cimex lectularius]XP_014240944.1 DCN1-like protein 3 [Cimex lectularius]